VCDMAGIILGFSPPSITRKEAVSFGAYNNNREYPVTDWLRVASQT